MGKRHSKSGLYLLLVIVFVLTYTDRLIAQNPGKNEELEAIPMPDGMIDLVAAPEKTFDGQIFLINDWDGGDKDNQNVGEELNRNSRIKEGVTILSHLPDRTPKKVEVNELVLDAQVLADASKKGRIAIAMGAHSHHTLAWLTKLPQSKYNYENIILVSHSNWNELDGRKGYEKNKKPGDPPLEDTHGIDLRRGLYPNLARISDLGVTIWEIPRTDMGHGGWGGRIATSDGDISIKALDISDLGIVHYLKTGIINARSSERNLYVSDFMKKPETIDKLNNYLISRYWDSNHGIPGEKKDYELPNILWIVTDDQRADALECYNMATQGQKESRLGYVSSPNIDHLASEGALFINAFCNSPACGPSRGSMLSGRYPFRNGHYAFELSHQNPDFIQPSFPQVLQKAGYVTTLFGKGDSYIYKWGPGQGFHDAGHYNYKMHFKHNLQKNNVGDMWNQPVYGEKQGTEERVLYPDGRLVHYYTDLDKGEISDEDIKKKEELEKEFDILRSYTRRNTKLIIGGENPQPAGKTVDGMIVKELKLYLENQDSEFMTSWGEAVDGADPGKPLLVNLGFHLPHTPVLPPKEYRDIFKKHQYKVPEFSDDELDKLPPQMVRLHKALNMSNMTDKEKQQAIQDYYAFCAYGDALIGEAVTAFKEYCKKNKQEYVIVYTVGDHGWHLGEQGIEAKFGPWKQSVHGAIIVVASDKAKVPAGLVQKQLVEYVDITPTILSACGVDIENEKYSYLDGFSLFDFIGNHEEKREYVVGEINLVAGPRAYMRSRDFAFSMRSRPTNKPMLNEDLRWALDCPVEEAELALYDLRNDPLERNNVAAEAAYAELAQWFREKLGNIVLGDGRIECDWSKPNTYALSSFAQGADDKKLDIPREIIPQK